MLALAYMELSRKDLLLLCLVNLGGERLRQRLAIDLHGIAAVAATADGHIRQSFAGLVPLARQSRNYASSRIVLVERCAQLLSCLRELLLKRVRLEHNGVPFVLEGAEKRGDRCEVRRARVDDLRRLKLDQVLDGEVLARNGIGVVFGNVRLDETLLEDISALARRDGLAGSFSRYGAEHCDGCGEIGAAGRALSLEVVANS